MTLDKPVKTYLMNAIQAAIGKISEISQVKHGQGVPIDQDTATYPWASFFDEAETKSTKNRVTVKSFDLVVQTWVKKGVTEIDDQMDVIDAKLEMALNRDDKDIALYSRTIEPDRSEKFVVDDLETGILQSVYKVTYCHAWKNPYELVKS